MILRPPRSTRTDTLFPYTTLFRSFAWSAALIAVLAVVLAGKGIGWLQEAGLLGVTPLAEFPRIPMLGVYPTAQTLVAQLAAAIVLVADRKSTRLNSSH